MPDLLVELLSEEIPARMQTRAAVDFRNLLANSLESRGLSPLVPTVFYTPRRLVLHIAEIPVKTSGMREERKGPRLNAPEQAINGFLRAAGLSSIDEAEIVSDPKKGDYYIARTDKPGCDAVEVISECLPDVIRKFPWLKSMKWGNGTLRWVRPLHSVVCTFGPVSGGTKIIEFELDGIPVGNETRGHRFMSNEPIKVSNFNDYSRKLLDAYVVLDAARRKNIILQGARDHALELGLELVEDEKLLEETAGLVEWPKVLTGKFDESFLEIPEDVIRTSIREHQKCFVMRNPETGKLSNWFTLVSNIEAVDGGKEIVSGNERVIAARLSDAKFFLESDLKTPLESMATKLEDIIFHEKLGTVAERVVRIKAVAELLTQFISSNIDQVKRAALLSKVDLASKMVGEFPELQGIMGRYYALKQGETIEVANAIVDHYKPIGQSDEVPNQPISVILALADKFEFLACFWYENEKPTGSKDPYALRRAALGLIQIIIINKIRIPLRFVFALCLELIDIDKIYFEKLKQEKEIIKLSHVFEEKSIIHEKIVKKFRKEKNKTIKSIVEKKSEKKFEYTYNEETVNDLLSFISGRLKVAFRERGIHQDLIDAVFALGDQDDMLLIGKRVFALNKFIKTQEGLNLLAGLKRAINILRVEEKKDGAAFDDGFKGDLLKEDAERELAELLINVRKDTKSSVENEDFVGAMESLARLRPAVDRFFDEILVNSEEPDIRRNRLNILNEFRQATLEVADFAKIGS